MRNLSLSLVVLLSILLSACQSGGGAAPTPQATPAVREPAQCTVSSLLPAQSEEESRFPNPTEKDWVEGPSGAAVVVLEYSDFQCPYCSQLAPVLLQLHVQYPQDVQIVFRHFPLPGHDKSLLAAQATEAAGLQGKFWEMNTQLFATQVKWVEMTPDAYKDWLVEQAKEMKLDVDKFKSDLTSTAIIQKVKDAQAEGDRLQIPHTPFVVINGRIYDGPRDLASLGSIVELFKLQGHQYSECPAMGVDRRKQYIATLETEKGKIVVQLYADRAPFTVNSFVFLAREGWFNGVTFHRVLPGFVAQAGDPSGSGMGGPGYAFGNEIDPALTFDREGMLGMANAGPNTNGSQFFITMAPATNLNGKYTVFGEVIEGMDVVKKLAPRDPQTGKDLPSGDKILSVQIEEK